MAEIFLLSSANRIPIASIDGKNVTDVSMLTTLAGRTFTFHLSWNALGKYWTVNILNDQRESVFKFLPQFGEMYPIRGLIPLEQEVRDAFVGFIHMNGKEGVIGKEDFTTDVRFIVMIGEIVKV